MYIANPLETKGTETILTLSSTHPPISERVRILRSMSGGANYIDYQNAFNKLKGSNVSIIPSSGLADHTTVGLKEATVTPMALGLNKQTKRDTGDIMMKVNNYSFINCSCGLKIKIPPDYKKTELFCPRCGTKHIL
ncbi:MAG: hypothetical protein MZV64_29345 [Ignavibacteriales bacterium]|nr:hypothetical protein [Ignavibacteriales bacterium]